MNEHEQIPSTIKEVGIHLVYISKKLGELDKKVEEMPNGFASIKELVELKTQVGIIDENYVSKEDIKVLKSNYWLSHTLTAVLTTIMVGLVGYFINNIISK